MARTSQESWADTGVEKCDEHLKMIRRSGWRNVCTWFLDVFSFFVIGVFLAGGLKRFLRNLFGGFGGFF